MATLQSPSKLLSVCVGPIMWSSACSPQAARLRASTHTPCRHSELTDARPNRLTAGTRCGGCGCALRQGWLCRALARCALWSRWVQTWPLSSACLTRPSSSVVVCLETSLLRGRSRLALQHHAPHLCAFSDPPGAGKGLTTHTLSMRHSLCSRGEGPCHGADPRYWKHGRPSSFPGLQGRVSARGVSQGVGAWGAGMRPPLLIPRVVSQGCQPGVCAWGAGRDQLH